MKNKEYAHKLVKLAAFLEKNADFPQPGKITQYMTEEEFTTFIRDIGPFKKEYTDAFVHINPIGLENVFSILIDRQTVCTRKVVGTKEVPERVIPAHVEEIVEWDCKPMLAEKKTVECEILTELEDPEVKLLG